MAMPDDSDESLLTEEFRARIGVKTGPAWTVIPAVDARYVRDVLEDRDPRYADATGIAPPYAFTILEPRPTADLTPHIVPRIMPGAVLTQTEWTFHRPFRMGERLQAVHQVADLRERLGGRFGRSILVVTHTEYRDEAGELVAESSHTVTQFDPHARQEEQ
jgi:acyl dehydratase